MTPRFEYEDLPEQIQSILAADAWWGTSGIQTFVDIQHLLGEDLDSTEGDFAEALRTKGLILGLESWAAVSVDQAADLGVMLAMPKATLIENPRVNRTGSGLGIRPAVAARRFLQAVLGQPEESILHQIFKLPASGPIFEPPRDLGGRVDYAIRLQVNTYIN